MLHSHGDRISPAYASFTFITPIGFPPNDSRKYYTSWSVFQDGSDRWSTFTPRTTLSSSNAQHVRIIATGGKPSPHKTRTLARIEHNRKVRAFARPPPTINLNAHPDTTLNEGQEHASEGDSERLGTPISNAHRAKPKSHTQRRVPPLKQA